MFLAKQQPAAAQHKKNLTNYRFAKRQAHTTFTKALHCECLQHSLNKFCAKK